MKRLSLGVLVGASALLVPLVMAQASSLDVDGGVLQAWTFDVDVDIEIEPPPTVVVTVQMREYAGESGSSGTVREEGTYTLAAGQHYWVEYSARTRDCDASITTPNQQTGLFTATEDLTHVLCVQKAQRGDITIRAGSADGPIVEPTGTSSGISSAVMAEEEAPPPITDDTSASPTPQPTIEPQTLASEPKPAEPESSPEEASTPDPATTESEEPTEAPNTPQPCAWEVREDDEGRTYLAEICPDATEGAEGDGTS